MKVADICTREVVSTQRSSSLQQAASLMREHHVGSLVVIGDSSQGAQVVGIVTDRDVVVEAVARGLDVTQTEIGRFADGKLYGIVSMDDLLDALVHEMSDMARAVRGGIEREAAERAPLPAARAVSARIPQYSFE